jgi:hypothetical protein
MDLKSSMYLCTFEYFANILRGNMEINQSGKPYVQHKIEMEQ